ncbi:MAG: BPSS1780 family membrane protein [Gallionella sp.]|nr:BPSS1780 family membrane protein [Gallionella sp.]MDD4957912.1 BPSS1780 family membrane protein [Gallionella sp.]
MKINRLPAIRGLVWIQQGYSLFMHNPTIWLTLSAINFAIFALLEQLGGVGAVASVLLSPVLVAGWLIGCHALAEDQPLKINHLWAGFQQNLPRLISLGSIVLLTLILISGIVMWLGGDTLSNIVENWKPTDDPEELLKLLGEDGLALLIKIFFLISIPMIFLGLSMQFAPMLIVFNDLTTPAALQMSIRAFLANIPPMTIYSLILMFGYAVLIQLPPLFHTALMIVVSPIFIGSAYAAYYNIFPQETVLPATNTTPTSDTTQQ